MSVPAAAADAEPDELAACRVLATTVVAVEDLHPHLRSITFGGGDLATFAPLGPDTFLHLMLARPGGVDVRFDPDFSWADVAPEDRPVGADVTVRAWRPAAHEIDVQFVLHGDLGAVSAWAGTARPGERVAVWGPRDAWAPPADTDGYLLVADDAGLPAVARILEVLAPAAPVVVVAEVDDGAARPRSRRTPRSGSCGATVTARRRGPPRCSPTRSAR